MLWHRFGAQALSSATLAVKVVGVTLVVASGLPCGREGPMVQLGAGVGALVLHAHNKVLALACKKSAHTEGRLLDEDLDTRDFVSMGAAAGVASAFDAPSARTTERTDQSPPTHTIDV